jgi:hypothetical protein
MLGMVTLLITIFNYIYHVLFLFYLVKIRVIPLNEERLPSIKDILIDVKVIALLKLKDKIPFDLKRISLSIFFLLF